MIVTDRGMIWGRKTAPSRLASAAASSTSRQWPGSSNSCATVKVTGRPLARAAATRRGISSMGFARSPPSRSNDPMVPATMASNTPWPDDPSARAKASTSSSGAYVPGTGRPDRALCPMVRDVVKPTAPAAMASPTIADMAAMSSAVASSLAAPRSPIT